MVQVTIHEVEDETSQSSLKTQSSEHDMARKRLDGLDPVEMGYHAEVTSGGRLIKLGSGNV